MMQNKLIIGVTGGSGSGKSTLSQCLEEAGCMIIDADKIAKSIMNPQNDAYNETVSHFGRDILNDDNTLNRCKLADVVFNDKAELDELNKITHKYIKNEIIEQIEKSKSNYIVIDAAVLIGSNMQELCDKIIAVLAPKEDRISRIMERDGISQERAEARISSQPSDEFYIAHSDYFVYNKNLHETKMEIIELFRRILVEKN